MFLSVQELDGCMCLDWVFCTGYEGLWKLNPKTQKLCIDAGKLIAWDHRLPGQLMDR